MSLRIVKPGAYATVQDLGRPGLGARGVPAGGAADRISHALANRIIGNPDGAATIEMTLVGATVLFEERATMGVTGAAPTGAPLNRAIDVPAGTTLALGPLTGGARCYLAVAGGVDVPLVLGSRSTHAASGLGGHEGRALRAQDVLKIGATRSPAARVADSGAIARLHSLVHRRTLRVVAGPHASSLGRAALDSLLASAFTVSTRSDRVGLRLEGPTLPAAGHAGEMITEPAAPGAIQSPPDGSPIVLGPDAPVTGGYPMIAAVIAADLPTLGQLAPRDTVRFELVSLGEALVAFRERLAMLDASAPPAINNRP